MFGQGVKISEEESQRSTISMNQNNGRGVLFAIESNSIYKPRPIAWRTKPPDLRTRRPCTYIYLLWLVRCSAIRPINPI